MRDFDKNITLHYNECTPNIAHFPGKEKEYFSNVLNALAFNKVKKPENLDIVVVHTLDLTPDNCPLLRQFKQNNIEYYNSIDKEIKWKATDKLKYIEKALAKCTKENVLILDANDVAIISFDNILARFASCGYDILYNGTSVRYPDMHLDTVENRDQYGIFKYLNAGCCIGKLSALRKFYREAKYYQEIFDETSEYKTRSEQFFIRIAFDLTDEKVFFDYKSEIFQCMHFVDITSKSTPTDIYLEGDKDGLKWMGRRKRTSIQNEKSSHLWFGNRWQTY